MAKVRLALRDAAPDDAAYMAAHLRERDREEVLATIGRSGDVAATIRAGIVASAGLCWTATNELADHRPVFVIGCTLFDDGVGSPWLLATDEVRRVPGALTRITKQHIAPMLETYSMLVNCVDARNVDSVRWLLRLGFTVDVPKPYGAEGRPFHLFSMMAA